MTLFSGSLGDDLYLTWEEESSFKRKELIRQLLPQGELVLTAMNQRKMEGQLRRAIRTLGSVANDQPVQVEQLRTVDPSLPIEQVMRDQQDFLDSYIITLESSGRLDTLETYQRAKTRVLDRWATQRQALQAKIEKDRRQFKKFLKGNGSSRMANAAYQYRIRFPFEYEEDLPPALKLQVNQGRRKEVIAIQWTKTEKSSYSYSSLSGMLEERAYFRWVDTSECSQVIDWESNAWVDDEWNRIFASYQWTPFPRLPNYKPRRGRAIRDTFKIFFPRNQSAADTTQLLPIIHLLRDSSLVIDTAHVEAFASIEGSTENNLQLQRERATVLMSLLTTYNRDEIGTSIETSEAWDLWRTQIIQEDSLRAWDYTRWLSFSDDSVKQLLETSDHRNRLEPWLEQQRSAVLHLTFTERFTDEKKLEKIYEDAVRNNVYYSRARNNASVRKKYQVRIAAIRRYVRMASAKGWLTFPDSITEEVFRIEDPWLDYMNCRDLLSFRRNGLTPVGMSYEAAALSVFEGAIQSMERELHRPQEEIRKNVVLDARNRAIEIQLRIYDQIEKGEVDSMLICQFREIPSVRAFRPNRYLKWLFQAKMEYNNGAPCSDPPIAYRGQEPVASATSTNMYLLRKERFMEGEQGNPEQYQSDLLYLLATNVRLWNPLGDEMPDTSFTAPDLLDMFKTLEAGWADACDLTLAIQRLNLYNKLLVYYGISHAVEEDGSYSELPIQLLEEISTYYEDKSYPSSAAVEIGSTFMVWAGILSTEEAYEYARLALSPQESQRVSGAQLSRLVRVVTLLQENPESVLLQYQRDLSPEQWCALVNSMRPYLIGSSSQSSRLQEIWRRTCR